MTFSTCDPFNKSVRTKPRVWFFLNWETVRKRDAYVCVFGFFYFLHGRNIISW